MAAQVRRSAAASSMRWPVRRSNGGVVGLTVAALLLVGGLTTLLVGVRLPQGSTALGLVVLGSLIVGAGAAMLATAIGFFRLAYELHPDRLTVRGGTQADDVRFDEIDGIYAGQRVGTLRRVQGVSWPGYHVGVVRGRSLGPLRVYCTDLRSDSIAIVATPDRAVVLSPENPAAFRRELIRRIEASQDAPAVALPRPSRHSNWLPHPAAAGLFAIAGALLLALAAGLSTAYSALPELVGLQLDPSGRPATLVPRDEVLSLPLLGFAVLALNGIVALAARGRGVAVAALLGGTCAAVQAVILLAVLRLLLA